MSKKGKEMGQFKEVLDKMQSQGMYYFRDYQKPNKKEEDKEMNNEYADDMLRARYFLNSHSEDNKMIMFLTDLAKSDKSHSEKWSDVYDFITLHYPNFNNVITGLVYLIENDSIWECILK